MSKFNNRARKFSGRTTFSVPVVSGDYANERITIGAVGSGQAEESFEEVQALVEGPFVAGATAELWLRKVADSTEGAASMDDADYTLAGTNFTTLTATGSVRWALSGWPGAQIRVKSGGFSGSLNVSATAL